MVAIYNPESEDEWVKIVRGDNWTQSFNAKDDAGDPFDLSGYSDWTAQWRKTHDDTVAYDLVVVSGGVTGVLTVSATPEQTRFMGNSDGWVDIQASSPEVRTFIQARTHKIKDVTRA